MYLQVQPNLSNQQIGGSLNFYTITMFLGFFVECVPAHFFKRKWLLIG